MVWGHLHVGNRALRDSVESRLPGPCGSEAGRRRGKRPEGVRALGFPRPLTVLPELSGVTGRYRAAPGSREAPRYLHTVPSTRSRPEKHCRGPQIDLPSHLLSPLSWVTTQTNRDLSEKMEIFMRVHGEFTSA